MPNICHQIHCDFSILISSGLKMSSHDWNSTWEANGNHFNHSASHVDLLIVDELLVGQLTFSARRRVDLHPHPTYILPSDLDSFSWLHLHKIVEVLYFHCSLSVCVCVSVCLCVRHFLWTKFLPNECTDLDANGKGHKKMNKWSYVANYYTHRHHTWYQGKIQ